MNTAEEEAFVYGVLDDTILDAGILNRAEHEQMGKDI